MKSTITKKAALYDPYLDVMGGGENHILSILKVLDENGYEITVFWDEDLTEEMRNKLNISFQHITFKPSISKSSLLSRSKLLKEFDMFFYVTDGSYFYSSAKQNIIFCMVPNKKLYSPSLMNKLKTYNAQFITNSQFTSKFLTSWGFKNEVIHPSISEEFFTENIKIKSKTILIVGRFFTHLHAKRQDVGIEWFQQLKKSHPTFADYQLILAGMVKKEDEPYFNSLQSNCADDSSIVFKSNISFTELLNLYRSSQFYWHFAGYGVDEINQPENVEHLGITPLEAMASGCITCAYGAGGPKEIITSGENGILFTKQDELYHQMSDLLFSQSKRDEMIQQARIFVQNTFSYEAFKKRVVDILKP
ncbi:MAG: glycosyltransferase family 4 protein [bacterium]|nr:glycosyltransferase family 4 protein [bacterium]